MAAFGIALPVLQIVPASNKAEVPGGFSAREADQDFLNHLEHAMERRDKALDRATARAEARETADTNSDAPRRGEGVSEAPPNDEKRKEGVTDGTIKSSDGEPVTDGDEVTNEPTSAQGDTAPVEDEGQPSKTADASAKDDTGESVASDATATENRDQLNETTAGNAVRVTSPAEGETVVAATGTPSNGENTTATFKATDDAADQRARVLGNAGEVVETGAAPLEAGTAAAAALPAKQAVDNTAADAPIQPVLATGTVAQPEAGAKDDASAELAVATPGEELASAASGAMAGSGKDNGKSQEKAVPAIPTEGPKVVLASKSDGGVKRPTDSGAVLVASAEDGGAGSSSKSKGFAPTTVPGHQQSGAQTNQTGLRNALASVTDTQGEGSNSALKLASLVSSTSPSPSGDAGAQKPGPNPSAGAPPPQAAAAGVANVQALQNASNQASPLRAAPPPPPPPNPAAFQVAIHVARAIDDGLERINIRLHPANLGRVEVKLEVAQDGRVTATVIADKADTLDMLQRDSRALERALQEAGLHPDSESLNFGLRGEQDHGEAGESGEGDQHANGQNDDGLDDIDVHDVIPPSRPLSAQAGALDIFV